MNKSDVLKMKPSAYKSMMLSRMGLTKTKINNDDLKRWRLEEWINLTAQLDGERLPCGKKGVKQQEKNLPSVCRPSKKVNKDTPKLAQEFTKKQIEKAIEIKKKGMRINWNDL